MCGIGAIFGHNESLKKDLERSLSKIEHRGSKTYESLIFHSCALGANRLAIIDEIHGRQPLTNEDKTVFVVHNGEIFNFKELKNELIVKGHQFTTDCDTEVLAHLWEEYGTKIVDKIDSEMFAFIVYDKRDENFFVARDPFGVKPLYYAHDQIGRLLIGSEIKQLAQFSTIKEIYEFPPGYFYYKGEFTPYFSYPQDVLNENKQNLKDTVRTLLEQAVKKRVQTNLPLGVFLSGGVDSSLIMELASRYHPDVTAIILGTKDSPDYRAALRLCREKGWKYIVIEPSLDYEREVRDLIYYLESYEPTIVRHSFANELVSRKAAELGLKIVLVGEGSDELFAGYNEFVSLKSDKINEGCIQLLKSLSKGHLMRVDKLAMRHTVEIRIPFFDTKLAKYALKIPGKLKVTPNEKIATKRILREIAEEYLPHHIANRPKAAFANGAGMNVGINFTKSDGLMSELAKRMITDSNFKNMKREYPEYNFSTKEEVYYFSFYNEFGYTKFKDGEQRLIVKDNLYLINDSVERKAELVLSLLLKHSSVDKRETYKFNDCSFLKNKLIKALQKNEEVSLLNYWGVEKKEVDERDMKAFDSLYQIEQIFKKLGVKSETILVLTDVHGDLNKVPSQIMNSYYEEIERIVQGYGFKAIRLSKLWNKYNYSINSANSPLQNRPDIEEFLIRAAKKHYKGENTLQGAKMYKLCSEIDSEIMCREYPSSVFLTYNGALWKSILPKLPIISLWSDKKGFHNKPWHVK